MRMQPEMSAEMAIAILQEDVVRIENDLREVRDFVTGNGDPKKGLLWLAADLGRLVATMTQMITEQQRALHEHVDQGHPRRNDAAWNWQRLGYDVLKQAAAYIVLALFVLIGLGFKVWVFR